MGAGGRRSESGHPDVEERTAIVEGKLRHGGCALGGGVVSVARQGRVAQMVERLPEKQQAEGSTTSAATVRMSFSGKDVCLPSRLRGFESRHPLHVTGTLPSVTESEVPVRIVWRVADMMLAPWPGLREGRCSRCRHRVYVDPATKVPPGLENALLVCVRCGLKDPVLSPEIRLTYAQVQAGMRR